VSVVLLEKELEWGFHQTGHNSGVIHSGLYYPPGSLKARLAVEGRADLIRFCREHDVPCRVCGKLVVATRKAELPRLAALEARARANGVEVRRLDARGLRNLEPHLAGLAGLHVPGTGVVDFGQVASTIARVLEMRGVQLCLGEDVRAISPGPAAVDIESDVGRYAARFLIACAGLQSDRVARLAGADTLARIVPFRGEYFAVQPPSDSLVRNLIYPVPDPRYPFLGVHLTRGIDDTVHAGPNARLALSREGYGRNAFDLADAAAALRYPGLWRMAARNVRTGAAEWLRVASRRAFARSVQRLVPEVRDADLVRSTPGVRAQALMPDGRLVDDFLIVGGPRSLHVLNAPSPAATAALPIGRYIARRIPDEIGS
jgi:L-2-hydroxyglutarate oxidase